MLSSQFAPGRNALFVFLAGLLYLPLSTLDAQLALSVGLDRDGYLLNEPVFAKVVVRNYSGRGLIFGENEALRGKIEFEIHSPDGRVLEPLDYDFDPFEGAVLNPGVTMDFILPVSRMYPVTKAGSYSIKAVMSHNQLPSSYESKPNKFSVFNGITVWTRIIGMPDVLSLNPESKIKSRTAKILSFFDGKKKIYALSIEDDRYIYGVLRLAPDIGGKKPDVEVDGLGRIHTLLQVGPNVYSYFVYNLDCRLEDRQNYVKADGVNPRLFRNEDQGTVTVIGGRKAIRNQDFIDEDYNPFFPSDSRKLSD
ncbi:MAG: hypothetical protein JW808_06415 [Victivallales bacterium]|nr:hypothetical protein [Victivallales bacterium]